MVSISAFTPSRIAVAICASISAAGRAGSGAAADMAARRTSSFTVSSVSSRSVFITACCSATVSPIPSISFNSSTSSFAASACTAAASRRSATDRK